MKTRRLIRIELTLEQKEQAKRPTSEPVPVPKLGLEVLEARLAPSYSFGHSLNF